MNENRITDIIYDTCIEIHRSLGPGLYESVYEKILAIELRNHGLELKTQVNIPLSWKGEIIDESFRADMIVEGKVLIELKSLEKTAPVHKKQVLTYLRLTGLKLGLLINFGEPLLTTGFTRLINGAISPAPESPVSPCSSCEISDKENP